MEGIEFKAHKVEQAIELGLKELQLGEDEVTVEIINHGGLFSKAVVKLTPKVKPEQSAVDFVNNLFSYMKFDAFAKLTKTETDNRIEITGADSSLLIGYRGDILDSVQYLALLVANKDAEDFVRISVNTENYRERRKEILTGLAKKLAQKAERTGRKVELEPMNPYERRIIHSALQDSKIVTTESVGEEPNRYLVIVPQNPKPYSDSRQKRDGGKSFNREKRFDGKRNESGSYGRERGYGRNGSGYNNYSGGREGYNNRECGNYNNRARVDYGEYGKSYGEKFSRTESDYGSAETETEMEIVGMEQKSESNDETANSNFSNNFKKNGTKNFKSFGYKRR
jgi:spoIIIJ-associated protein